MGKIIRRTITVTFRETWTIVWLPGDDPLPHPPTDDQAQANTEEQSDEALQATIILAEPAPTPPTPAAVEPQPGGAGAVDSSTARRAGKRTRSRRAPSGRKANRSTQ
jgi:hypothetical protein